MIMHVSDPQLWIEAGIDMPGHAKERCVCQWALERLHAKGVLHGDIQLRHFVITSDWCVQIVDFSRVRVCERYTDVLLDLATQEKVDLEMHGLKEMLDMASRDDAERAKEGEPSSTKSESAAALRRHRSLPPMGFIVPGQMYSSARAVLNRMMEVFTIPRLVKVPYGPLRGEQFRGRYG